MKTLFKIYLLMIVALLFTTMSCDEESIIEEEVVSLTTQEIQTLQFLIEEEKLARDVYLFLNDLHDHYVFKNISGSEQKHIYFVQQLLQEYEIENPASEERGVFQNEEIKALYITLTELGSQSLEKAFIVGATIEDLDINDLNRAILSTDKEDLIQVFRKLRCGSRNHLRAFTSQLEELGSSYSPQYLSESEYNEILEGEHESCGSI
jgi:hypothetical protein